MDAREDGGAPRYDGGGPALGHLFGFAGVVGIRNNLFPELEVFGEKVDGGQEAEVTLRERNTSGEGGDGISRKVVRLEAKFIKEMAHEIAGRKPEPALKMGNKNDILTGLEIRRKLGTREPACHASRHVARLD